MLQPQPNQSQTKSPEMEGGLEFTPLMSLLQESDSESRQSKNISAVAGEVPCIMEIKLSDVDIKGNPKYSQQLKLGVFDSGPNEIEIKPFDAQLSMEEIGVVEDTPCTCVFTPSVAHDKEIEEAIFNKPEGEVAHVRDELLLDFETPEDNPDMTEVEQSVAHIRDEHMLELPMNTPIMTDVEQCIPQRRDENIMEVPKNIPNMNDFQDCVVRLNVKEKHLKINLMEFKESFGKVSKAPDPPNNAGIKPGIAYIRDKNWEVLDDLPKINKINSCAAEIRNKNLVPNFTEVKQCVSLKEGDNFEVFRHDPNSTELEEYVPYTQKGTSQDVPKARQNQTGDSLYVSQMSDENMEEPEGAYPPSVPDFKQVVSQLNQETLSVVPGNLPCLVKMLPTEVEANANNLVTYQDVPNMIQVELESFRSSIKQEAGRTPDILYVMEEDSPTMWNAEDYSMDVTDTVIGADDHIGEDQYEDTDQWEDDVDSDGHIDVTAETDLLGIRNALIAAMHNYAMMPPPEKQERSAKSVKNKKLSDKQNKQGSISLNNNAHNAGQKKKGSPKNGKRVRKNQPVKETLLRTMLNNKINGKAPVDVCVSNSKRRRRPQSPIHESVIPTQMIPNLFNTSDTVSDEMRRAHHNNLEKRRREDLKVIFWNLKQCIPELSEVDFSAKILILQKAVEYIQVLRSKERSLLRELATQRHYHKRLTRRLEIYH